MMRYLPILLLLAACGPIPVQMSSQRQSQSSKQEVAQDVANDLAQTSSHASESKQGTNSMPVIVICNNNAANGRCIALPENAPLLETTQQRFKGNVK
jgi:hypothetical protein